MKYGVPFFLKLIALSLFSGNGKQGKPTISRVIRMFIFIPVYFFNQILHWICFLLDEVLYSDYRNIQISGPIFIVGIPRSGTTFLHRVLSKDTENFTTFKLWEIVHAPSIVERKFWRILGRVDQSLGGSGLRGIKAIDHKVRERTKKIHKISLFEPEEDELVLQMNFSSIFLSFVFPFSGELENLMGFDWRATPDVKKKIMNFYRACLQRHMYFHGTDKRFLSKNPVFSTKIEALNEYFPDSILVCCIRNPYNALPSFLSLLNTSWNWFENDMKGHRMRDGTMRLAGKWYRHPMDRLPRRSDNHYTFLTYDALARNLEETISNLYKRFGLNISPSFQVQLKIEDEKSRNFKSNHVYSLEDFSLTPERILEEYSDIFEYYGFNTDHSLPGDRRGVVREMK